MKIGEKKVIDGTKFRLLKSGLTKAEATKEAIGYRRGGFFRARIEKVARGNYRVWVA